MSKKKTQQKADTSKKQQRICDPQCCCSKEKSSASVRCNKNRVTLFSALGQTESDKYTLECAAKVNDTSISPEFFSQYYNTSDDQDNSENDLKELTSHAVQVNIRECWEKPDSRPRVSHDQAIQCKIECLSLVPDGQNFDSTGDDEALVIKKCNSPVIVISVYQKPHLKISADKVLRKSKPASKKHLNNRSMVEKAKKPKEIEHISQNHRMKSRSASPINKKFEKNKEDNSIKPQKTPKPKIKKNNLSNTNRKIIKSEPQKVNNNYTTEIKQTLIDKFIKSMESKDNNYAKFLLSVPKSTASKITIDLNNKQQSNFALKSDKIEKGIENQIDQFRYSNKAVVNKNISLDNDKIGSDKQSPSTNNFGKYITKHSYSKPMQIHPRDSLVVSHSREIRRSDVRTGIQKTTNTNKTGNAGTRRHHRGDNCPIDDPNIRDNEIKQLLGLTKPQPHSTRLSKTSGSFSRHCGFKKCPKKIIICVNRKHQPRSFFTQREHDENYNRQYRDVAWQDKSPKVKATHYNTSISKSRVPKSHSHRIDKGTFKSNRPQNPDFLYPAFHTNQTRLIWDYDFFHAQKPYRYRRNKIPIKRYNKTTMTTKNPVSINIKREKDESCSSLVVGKAKIEVTGDKRLHYHRNVQTENFFFEKYAQTEKKSYIRRRLKMGRDSYNTKQNINNLLKIDSEKIIEAEKICLRPTVSVIEVSNNHNFISKSKKPKSYINQKGDGIDLKINKQVDYINSLHVIYECKGRKRSVTPNLGTSFVSKSVISSKTAYQKPHVWRKPFISRIFSCLVQKLHRNSNDKKEDLSKKYSNENTVGSYYINSSLAPWDMCSVIFDTSASYYSSHSLHAKTKIKRGFITSLCGYIARRKK